MRSFKLHIDSCFFTIDFSFQKIGGLQELIRLSKLVISKSASYIDAPLSGGEWRSKNGNISVLASGKRKSFNRALPVLKEIGYEIVFLGEKLGSYRFNYSYSKNSLDGSITSTNDSSVDTNLKLHISPQNVLTIQGEVLPKSKTVKTIFKELNISPNPNIKTQLFLFQEEKLI